MTAVKTEALQAMSRQELTDLLNLETQSNLKPTSYTKTVLVEKLQAHFAKFAREPEVAEEPAPEGVDFVTCPLCLDTNPADEFTRLGEEGTPLGACLSCPSCKKAFNEFSEEEVEAAPAKRKRKIMNPQPVIDAKKAYLFEKTKASLEYDREERTWFIQPEDEDAEMIPLTSKTLSETTKEGLVKIVEKATRRAGRG